MTATARVGDASVCAVIVTYNPDISRLRAIIQALSDTVCRIAIVDNASADFNVESLLTAFPALTLRRLPENRGIGAAQNEGVAIARATGARYLLFLDQDSVPESGMVRALVSAFDRLTAAGERVGCVGPRVRLPGRDAPSVFNRIGWLRLRSSPCPDEDTAVECDYVISSGSLIPSEVIDDVGGMEEGLFIDQVDTEWCLRARAKRYKIFGACDAVLQHRLGESHQRIWLGRWRRLPRHKPFRYYYIFRNTILIARRTYVPMKYTLFHLEWLAALFVLYGLLAREGNGELRMMLRGIADGIRGVTGKLEHA